MRAETSRRWEGGEELAIRRYGEEVYSEWSKSDGEVAAQRRDLSW